MTLDHAKEIAVSESIQHGLTLSVYRMPRWAPDVYGVRDPAKLPAEAVKVATYAAPSAPVLGHPPVQPDAPKGQGDLFS